MAKKTPKKKIIKKSTPKKAVKAAKKVVKKSIVKKVAVKKPVIKKVLVKKPMIKPVAVKPVAPRKNLVGVVTHFYDHISVAVIEVMTEIKVGDTIEIVGHEQSFKQKVLSMQIEHEQVKAAKKKQIIGMKVARPVKEKDLVYKV
ncbi:MAG: U32 family peptidase C-terminal domain-containing protein [Candidatus Woesearchaeota archaeon]